MAFKPTQKLRVWRCLSTGEQVEVGVLAQNKQGVFFQYVPEYLACYGNLSPFSLKADISVQLAPTLPHAGLHGVFADALPDGWGTLLQDRIFRQHGVLPTALTSLDRLAFVGRAALGALSFTPMSDYAHSEQDADLARLGINAQQIYDGQTNKVLAALVAAGSSGGARPKAQVYAPENNLALCSTVENTGDSAWIVKFTSKNLPLAHEEGLCEAAYLTLAKQAGLEPPDWSLVDAPSISGAVKWLAVKRFDHLASALSTQPAGRLHMHSACGLLDADFRSPALDYDDLIRASRVLCRSAAVGQLQFKRAVFNLLVANQDDHSKNWAFLQDDQGRWQPAPFYDVTYSPHPFAEHATAFAGYGKQPPLAALQKLANSAGFAKWQDAKVVIEILIDQVAAFPKVAKSLGVSPSTIKLIDRHLQQLRLAVTSVL